MHMPRSLTIYIDMDDTLFDFTSARVQALQNNPAQPFPQSQVGFFLNLQPLPGALAAYDRLKTMGHHALFLTAPSVKNPLCYTEKRMSIERHFGYEACRDLIIAHDKSLLRGDVLIDDRSDSNKQTDFQGVFLQFGSVQFPDWTSVLREITRVANL